jgi:hypothetical protein
MSQPIVVTLPHRLGKAEALRRLKPALRLEWRGQDGQDEAEQCKHCALTLGDSFS